MSYNDNYDYYDDDKNNYQNDENYNSPAQPMLVSSASDLVAAASGGGDCCPHVVDPLLFAAILAGIAIIGFYLHQQITMNLRKRRKRRQTNMFVQDEPLLQGESACYRDRKAIQATHCGRSTLDGN
jgi:hypothetical protein